MRRCGERMASKAARQEPTLKGYHTGLRRAGRESPARPCVLSGKTRQINRQLGPPRRVDGDSVAKKALPEGRGVRTCQLLSKLLRGNVADRRRANREIRRRIVVPELHSARNGGR